MIQKSIKFLKNIKVQYALILLFCLLSGLFLTFSTFDASLGMGDNSTFYAFARNIMNGEAYMKDFIHFRTPGTVTMFAVFMKIFGSEQSTIEIGTRLETLVLFPLLFLIAGIIIFWSKKRPIYILLAYLGIMFIPGVAQLRAAFGLLAVAIYIRSFEVKRHVERYLIATGVLAGVTFFFGQEVALMVGVCVTAGELVYWLEGKSTWRRIGLIAGGAAISVLPQLMYMAVFSNVGNFLYYTLYYSFIQQPKFMDLPFPNFSLLNLMYYLPFVLYFLCFVVLYGQKTFGKKEALLLSFGVLRLITAMGRSDFGHFLFSIPEVFLIVPYFLWGARDVVFSRKQLLRFAPYGALMIVLFALAITKNSIFMIFIPFVIMIALSRRGSDRSRSFVANINWYTYLSLGATFVLLIYMLTPTYLAVARSTKVEFLMNDRNAPRIGGVKTDIDTYNTITAMRAAVAPLRPKTVFSFPIQPFYYSLAEHHASRYMTFEPQTTLAEQHKTIEDLKRTKPEVIIFDPLQAHGLSGPLSEISNYITEHYQVHKEIASKEILWVMTPKQNPSRDDKLAFNLYKENAKNSADGVENPATALNNAILQKAESISFKTKSSPGSTLVLRIVSRADLQECGAVKVSYAGKDETKQFCSWDGEARIPISGDATIRLEKQSTVPILWDDVRIVQE